MLLAHLGRPDLDRAIGEAVKACLASGHVTPELGGTLSTSEATQAVLDALEI
jgi:isocitrate/isopropylmalate dehydrogenase